MEAYIGMTYLIIIFIYLCHQLHQDLTIVHQFLWDNPSCINLYFTKCILICLFDASMMYIMMYIDIKINRPEANRCDLSRSF